MEDPQPLDLIRRIKAGEAKTADANDSDEVLLVRLRMTRAASERFRTMAARGADCFIASSDGQTTVRASLTDSVHVDTQSFQAGNILIDWTHGTISHKGDRVTVSRTELRLLGALADADGRAVSRASLIAATWPRNDLPTGQGEGALAVCICSLRKRLVSVGLVDALKTVRPGGYQLDFQ